jgi:transcriptional regulator with XRE-family HTH domain
LAEDLGLPLAKLRRFVDLTQVELAQRLLVTQPSVSEIERSESPAVPTVRRYVEALGAPSNSPPYAMTADTSRWTSDREFGTTAQPPFTRPG